MFDIGWGEMLVIAIVVIVVVGPKELPGMLRTFGRTTAKLRVMANDFRKQFDEALKEAELDDVKKIADDVRSLNPAGDIRKALSPMEKAAQDVRAGFDKAMKPMAKPDTAAAPAASEPKPAEPLKQGATAMPGEKAAATPAGAANGAKPAAAAPAARPAAGAKPAPKPARKPAAKAAAKPAATKTAAKPAAAKARTGGAAS